MIVCSCNMVTSEEIREAVAKYAGTFKIPSVETIMNDLGKETDCATCAKNMKAEIRKSYVELSKGHFTAMQERSKRGLE